MNVRAYYNEIDAYAAQWLRNLIAAGHIPAGDVDERSIVDVHPDDLRGYTQCHFFAGIGGWAYAARLAGWPDDRELWTGSCPCQPFSVAGKQLGTDDERHLWPHQFRLIRARRPAIWMGEQVAAAVGKNWLDGVCADLESIGYACGAVVVPACSVNAPHRRDRAWIVADSNGSGLAQRKRCTGNPGEDRGADEGKDAPYNDSPMAHAVGSGRRQAGCNSPGHLEKDQGRSRDWTGDAGPHDGSTADGGDWIDAEWIAGHDGKARRVEPGIRLLAHGVPARVGRLRAYGNAIVPQVAAEVIAAYTETCGGITS